jgi:hypothetical protein
LLMFVMSDIFGACLAMTLFLEIVNSE